MAFWNDKKTFPDKHLEVVLRSIGHQVLLHSKDSTSRVLPVLKINERVYQISFENSFGFTPDTLIHLVHQQLAKTNMPRHYIVTVNDCYQNKTVFAYEINRLTGDLTPCGQREQEAGCYFIQIEFIAGRHFNYMWLLTIVIPIAGFYLNRRQNKQGEPGKDNNKTSTAAAEHKRIGEFRFFDTLAILRLNDKIIELSEKEVKALRIFASNQNQVVERDRLRKEIWEDDGVFVINRNVDVLVSKLRKKLNGDPSVKIVNVHGKGYKCMTGEENAKNTEKRKQRE